MNVFTQLLKKYDDIPTQIHTLATEDKDLFLKHYEILDLLAETFDNHFQFEIQSPANGHTRISYTYCYNGHLYQETLQEVLI